MTEFITEGAGVPAAAGPYSAGVVAGDLCFLSGQLALDPGGSGLVGETAADQVRQAMRNLFAVARAGGFAAEETTSPTTAANVSSESDSVPGNPR